MMPSLVIQHVVRGQFPAIRTWFHRLILLYDRNGFTSQEAIAVGSSHINWTNRHGRK
jgi:hypothetical protein